MLGDATTVDDADASARTTAWRLGNPNGAAALRRAEMGGQALREAVARNADAFASDVAPILDAIRAEGHTTLRAMASELNARGILTRRGGPWHVSTVTNLVRRVERSRERI